MLAIARALLSRPKLLLLDEPSLGLAPLIVRQVYDAIVELRAQRRHRPDRRAERRPRAGGRRPHLCAEFRAVIAMSGRSAELHGTAAFDAAYFGYEREARAMIVLQNAIDAISLGAVYALAALGIGLIFSIMRLINFAHGELIMVGGFTLYGLAGQPYLVMVLAAVLVVDDPGARHGAAGLPAAAQRQSGDAADRLLRRLLSGAAYRADDLRLAADGRRFHGGTRRERRVRRPARAAAADRRRSS